MIQAVIFDVGGVLLRTTNHSYRRAWDKKLGLKDGTTEHLVLNSEMGRKAQLGQISNEALWQWVGSHLGLKHGELAAFRHDFWAGDVLDQALVALIRGLHGRYQTAIISNYNDDLRRELTHDFGIADTFDEIIISSEVQVMKPDPQIYHIALQKLARKPEEAVFIDDFQHNVQAAQDIGMAAIHFTPSTDLRNELTMLGINLQAL